MARISGRAAAFAVKQADGWLVTRRGRPGSTLMALADVARVLGETPDVVKVEVKTLREVESRLEIEWAKDRALRLTIIILDPQESAEGLPEVANLLEGLMARPHVSQHLENQFYQHTLPDDADVTRASILAKGLPLLDAFVGSVIKYQNTIATVSRSFESLDDSIFGGAKQKAEFREQAVSVGAFRTLVCASHAGAINDVTLFSLYRSLSGLQETRQIVKAWTAAFERIEHILLQPIEYDDELESDVADFGGGAGARERLQNALEQQSAILGRVADGDYDNARKFARELATRQLADGGASYLAKSFTRLSQRAREMEAFELELEWAFLAVEHSPSDGRARTHYADALIQADRIDDGLSEYERAAELGQPVYALNARARAMRKLGLYAEELRLFQEAAGQSSGGDERVFSLVGIAQAKVDLGDSQAGLEQLQATVDEYPAESLVRLSLASAFLRKGQFTLAWEQYEIACTLKKGLVSGANGLAEICRATGHLSEARRRYSDIASEFPRDIQAHIGLIDTLRALGERSTASVYARRTAERFPGSSQAAAKHATTVSEMGRHGQARQLFRNAILRFPKDARLQASQASAYRREGRFEKSLQTIDAAILRFPHNRRLQRVRADLLRLLDNLPDARRIYEDLVEVDPSDIKSRNGLSAILLLEGENSAVINFIGNDDPATPDQWRSFLLVASAIERSGDVSGAQSRLSWAIEHCPFATERRMFANSLAALVARLGRARKAPRIERVPDRDIGNIVDFQIAAMTRQSRAATVYSALTRNLPERYGIIRDEIARTYGVLQGPPKKSKRWIGEALEREILLAA
ncbi:tetratricopeptide repeat protein [Sphingomonas sp. STIS6.2]|uniref:tetratricopeptide repeat protein n=1 Tax=Sphingomonas sp. STIS6.2 TaxID=1379700 RepID=UPI0009DD9F48|nr:tetratricopeptide repeat protein [Sphingomonas sp. STIS6.2]